jgi:hypothetical protein
MILLLSGEGPTDIGSCVATTDECEGKEFRAGPMALMIDRLVEPIWGYSPLEAMAFMYVSERLIASRSKRIQAMALPGSRKAIGTIYFFKNARALARMAMERTAPHSPVGAVFFRDSDGTCAAGNSLWQDKWDSILQGFEAENFLFGVPMVPKPKSEAWLLCAVQQNPYDHCSRFEDISGNDASPNPAKKQLNEFLAAREMQLADLCDMIRNGRIQPAQIVMPSYDRFRARLEEVARGMAGIQA